MVVTSPGRTQTGMAHAGQIWTAWPAGVAQPGSSTAQRPGWAAVPASVSNGRLDIAGSQAAKASTAGHSRSHRIGRLDHGFVTELITRPRSRPAV
jgi:hypothetical protein